MGGRMWSGLAGIAVRPCAHRALLRCGLRWVSSLTSSLSGVLLCSLLLRRTHMDTKAQRGRPPHADGREGRGESSEVRPALSTTLHTPTSVPPRLGCTLLAPPLCRCGQGAQGVHPAPASHCPIGCQTGSGQEDTPASPLWASPAGFGAQDLGWWLGDLEGAGVLRLVSRGWGAGMGRSWDSQGSPVALLWPRGTPSRRVAPVVWDSPGCPRRPATCGRGYWVGDRGCVSADCPLCRRSEPRGTCRCGGAGGPGGPGSPETGEAAQPPCPRGPARQRR